jgi:hypothetical protein
MPTPDVDVVAILATLDRHTVDYVIIGGFAAELHDVAIPPTRDIDITPASDVENLRRLSEALNELDARFRVVDGPPEGVEIPDGITPEWLRSMITVALTTSAGPFDVCMRPDGTAGFDDLIQGRQWLAYGDSEVPVASLEDVIRSKEAVGRQKDLLVIPALRAHLARSRRQLGTDQGTLVVPVDFDEPLPDDVQDDFDR